MTYAQRLAKSQMLLAKNSWESESKKSLKFSFNLFFVLKFLALKLLKEQNKVSGEYGGQDSSSLFFS